MAWVVTCGLSSSISVAQQPPAPPPKVAPSNQASPPSAPGVWEQILALFGDTSSMSAITRGSKREGPPSYGDLWSVDARTGTVKRLTQGQRLRSPLVTSAGTFALSASGLVVFRRAFDAPVTVRLPVDVGSVSQLLALRDGRLLASARDCVVRFGQDGKDWEVKGCGLTETQLRELLIRSRTCGGRTVDERIEGSPPLRVDVLIREPVIGRSLTEALSSQFHTEPRFFPDCSQVVFVAQDEPGSVAVAGRQ